jgi:hypothetical protein
MQKLTRRIEFGKAVDSRGLPLGPRERQAQVEPAIEMLKGMLPSCEVARDDNGLIGWLARNGR